ncbi:MAG TPA: LysR family transcriptional regulator [Candidatus Scatomorpha merdipullorum]|uniref:LysR family transcriptional regulator n=1 Tax=Candidatus Scatomorpha merdipullorum TaxID=2840927 RepID=A0A9D1JVN3_9FIRM|nr:LysR family transcriptional regulator [Candidatus Scatomorpha merdipullorum]
MPVNKYEAFLLSVELGSITRAAENLGVTQSAVSHMISSLEAELGFALLRRGRGGAVPTAEGQSVTPAIRGILTARERLDQMASAIRGLDSGTVRIGTFTSVGVHWLPGIIAEFQADYPSVELKLMSGDYHDVEQWLADGSADIGFVPLPTRLGGEVVPLRADRLLAVIPANHPLADAAAFPVAELERESFIGLLETSDRDARGALAAAGVSPHIKYKTKDDYAVIAMIERGLGVSIMPELLLRSCSERVRCLELDPPASRTIGLCMPDAERAGPATRRFAEYAAAWVEREG